MGVQFVNPAICNVKAVHYSVLIIKMFISLPFKRDINAVLIKLIAL